MTTATASRTTTRTRKTPEQREHERAESLSRAIGGMSTMNYGTILEGFAAKGIPMAEVSPRENVFTYNAWLAQDRQVRKGEKGVKIITFIPMAGKQDTTTGERTRGACRPWSSTVFHISQTDPVAPNA